MIRNYHQLKKITVLLEDLSDHLKSEINSLGYENSLSIINKRDSEFLLIRCEEIIKDLQISRQTSPSCSHPSSIGLDEAAENQNENHSHEKNKLEELDNFASILQLNPEGNKNESNRKEPSLVSLDKPLYLKMNIAKKFNNSCSSQPFQTISSNDYVLFNNSLKGTNVIENENNDDVNVSTGSFQNGHNEITLKVSDSDLSQSSRTNECLARKESNEENKKLEQCEQNRENSIRNMFNNNIDNIYEEPCLIYNIDDDNNVYDHLTITATSSLTTTPKYQCDLNAKKSKELFIEAMKEEVLSSLVESMMTLEREQKSETVQLMKTMNNNVTPVTENEEEYDIPKPSNPLTCNTSRSHPDEKILLEISNFKKRVQQVGEKLSSEITPKLASLDNLKRNKRKDVNAIVHPQSSSGLELPEAGILGAVTESPPPQVELVSPSTSSELLSSSSTLHAENNSGKRKFRIKFLSKYSSPSTRSVSSTTETQLSTPSFNNSKINDDINNINPETPTASIINSENTRDFDKSENRDEERKSVLLKRIISNKFFGMRNFKKSKPRNNIIRNGENLSNNNNNSNCSSSSNSKTNRNNNYNSNSNSNKSKVNMIVHELEANGHKPISFLDFLQGSHSNSNSKNNNSKKSIKWIKKKQLKIKQKTHKELINQRTDNKKVKIVTNNDDKKAKSVKNDFFHKNSKNYDAISRNDDDDDGDDDCSYETIQHTSIK